MFAILTSIDVKNAPYLVSMDHLQIEREGQWEMKPWDQQLKYFHIQEVLQIY